MTKRQKLRQILSKHNEGLGSNDDTVDAILAELREPTREMIEAGNTVTQDAGDVWEPSHGISYGGPSCGLECWQAMIDAIK